MREMRRQAEAAPAEVPLRASRHWMGMGRVFEDVAIGVRLMNLADLDSYRSQLKAYSGSRDEFVRLFSTAFHAGLWTDVRLDDLALANAIGCDQQTIWYWRNGRRAPRTAQQRRHVLVVLASLI
jgi:hypothetical protein